MTRFKCSNEMNDSFLSIFKVGEIYEGEFQKVHSEDFIDGVLCVKFKECGFPLNMRIIEYMFEELENV